MLVMKCGLLSVIQLHVESLVWALITPVFLATPSKALRGTKPEYSRYKTVCVLLIIALLIVAGGSVAEWLACWTQAQKGPGSNRSHDSVG